MQNTFLLLKKITIIRQKTIDNFAVRQKRKDLAIAR